MFRFSVLIKTSKYPILQTHCIIERLESITASQTIDRKHPGQITITALKLTSAFLQVPNNSLQHRNVVLTFFRLVL